MELTGKAQKDFWKWYLKPEQKKEYKTEALYGGDNAVKLHFVAQSFAERYGVYIDWLYSIGGDINYSELRYFIQVGNFGFSVYTPEIPNHKDRRKYTINRLNDMYNNVLPLY